MAQTERIEQVYIYDASVVTHLCELTPSYCLEPLEARAIFKDEAGVSDEVRDHVSEELIQHNDHDVTYMHASAVDALEKMWKDKPEGRWRFKNLGDCADLAPDREDFEDEEDYEGALMDAVREYCSGNAQI
jgi:hypothetical protein